MKTNTEAAMLSITIVGVYMRYIPVEMADALAGGRGAAHRRRGSTLKFKFCTLKIKFEIS